MDCCGIGLYWGLFAGALEARQRRNPSGAKARAFMGSSAARLKSCPVTKRNLLGFPQAVQAQHSCARHGTRPDHSAPRASSRVLGKPHLCPRFDSQFPAPCPPSRFQKFHESGWLEVGVEDRLRETGGSADCFGGEMAAAGGAFHGGGPAGADPVACEE